MKRQVEYDLQAMLNMVEKGSAEEVVALTFIEEFRQASLRVIYSDAESSDKVEVIGQLRETLLYRICSLFDPFHDVATKPEIILPEIPQ